jgi:PEP-CTERM putative exosortase interaction domain
MKKLLTLPAVLALSAAFASAQTLMLDFGPNAITAGAETTSPGHAVGTIPLADTAWNHITTSAPVSTLKFANGTNATGVSLTMGQEATGGSNIINYSTAITNLALQGNTSAATGKQNLRGPGSIYGDIQNASAENAVNTAGRDGFFGGGASTSDGAAIGLRIDGLAVGNYVVYVMARNTNVTSSAANSMNIYSFVGAFSGTFDFNSLDPVTEVNTNYASAGYAGQYTVFTAGENYVAINVSIGEGQSLFLAIDGAILDIERRGFLNMVQVVAVPEPAELSMLVAAGLGLLVLVRRRKMA